MTSRLAPSTVRLRHLASAAAALLLGLGLSGVALAPAQAEAEALPLGDRDLAETRTTRTLGPGVTLTRIVRGTEPAPPEPINTTTRGPWRVHVLTIDPEQADGQLRATYGPDLARVEKTTDLVRLAGALAGVNASFFTFTADSAYPGDPVGLGLYGGKLLSEPTTNQTEIDMVISAPSSQVLMGHLRWAGHVQNRQTGERLTLEYLNHPPKVPADCADMADQTRCPHPGDLVRFTPEFGAATPSGAGVEVVLDPGGCVVRTFASRGTTLGGAQTSLQATGRDSRELLGLVNNGCLSTTSVLRDEDGERLTLRPGTYGVNGRYRLTEDGRIVVPDESGSFFARNPRTIAGTTADGQIRLVTIDGRQTTSVGTTMQETAAVAQALDMSDAVNLDGGGSTAMSVNGDLVNQPSSPTERAVGDALVYVPAP
jgi:Phosphodiester glycosidase